MTVENRKPVQADAFITIPRARLAELEKAEAEVAALQAEIDRLMLEFCPDEMEAAQMVSWDEHQAAVRRRCKPAGE